MNKIILIGRLVKEPELRQMPNGDSVLANTIAVNRDYTNQNGEREADFINFVAYRKTAELIAQYIHKGDGFGIEGALQTRSYEAQDGTKRYVTEVKVDKLEFLPQNTQQQGNNSYNNQQNNPYNYQQNNQTKNDPFANVPNQDSIYTDDLPF